MIKAYWIFSIIKALEDRLFYLKDNDDTSSEIKVLDEIIDYFRSLEMEDKKKGTTEE